MNINPVAKFGLFFVLPMAVLILWIGGFFSSRVEPGYAAEEGKLVKGLKTIKVEPTITEEIYKVDGSVMSNNNAKVATKIMGKIKEIYVKEGDTVKDGQLLALIDTSDIDQQIREAKAGLEEIAKAKEEVLAGLKGAKTAYEFTKRTYERFKSLYEENAIPKQKLEEIETKMIGVKSKLDGLKAKLEQINAKEKQIKAKLKYAQVMKGYGEIYAPFDGIVIKKMMDVGDMASPGMPILIIGQNKLVFYSQIDEKLFNKVNLGDELRIKITTINKEYKGKVIEKSNSIDPMNRSFSVKIEIPNDGNLSPGMYGKIYIPVKKDEKVLIPKSAVFKWGQLNAVYIVDKNGVLRLNFIKLGEDYGDKVEVVSGLEKGMVIIADNVEKACDGCRIK
ncbi:MAG: efflux RND transporter periplasmic adaptor subunit [Persephonella sp.]|nr:MAG: efflux RND transporter periplasmic adaptor subunit [Persephonella sp.]RUM60230.1 MAG: efflux RND transporter periplasmic adaptor subunit [Persephonella sp.]